MADIVPPVATWLELLSAIGGIMGMIGGGMIWLVKNSLVTRPDLSKALEPFGEQADAADRRLAVIETELRHMPTQRDLANLTERVANLATDVGKISVGIDGINNLLARIERPLNVLIDERMKDNT